MEVIVHRDIGASRKRIWDTITDIEHFPDILSGVERVERLDDGNRFDVGTRWEETRAMFGKEATEQMEVSSLEPGTAYSTTAEHGATTYTSTLRLDVLDAEQCRLTMTFGAEATGAVGRLLAATVGRAFQSATRKMLQRDLDDIAVVAESPPLA